MVFFLALRNDAIKYDLDLYSDNLPVEKWVYLMSAFYQRRPSIIFDPVFVMNIKTNIDIYNMLVESPQWFNENGDFFNGLHAIEFGKCILLLSNNIFYLHFIKVIITQVGI